MVKQLPTSSPVGNASGDAGEPLWERLLADLRRRLDNDEFADGFPGELALVGEYGVSRGTVRRAVKVLRDEGLVVGQRGRPSRQAEPAEIAQRLGSLYSLNESVRAAGLDQHSLVLSLNVQIDPGVAGRLGLKPSTPLVYLERVRFAGQEPLALDQAWLPHSLAAPLLDVDFSDGALYDYYTNLCGVVLNGGEESIQPVVPTPSERHLLDLPSSTAAFLIQRLGKAKGSPVEWRQTLVRGDRFALCTDFASKAGYYLDLLVSSAGD